MADKYKLPNRGEWGDAYNALTSTVGKKKNELMDMLAPYFSDYGQLIEEGSPLNNQYQQLKSNISQHIPSNADFRSPQAMSEWSQAAALNAPMGLALKGAKPTKFSQAHDVAQKNAALPVEQGGLGLPMNNTAMDRARAMGFDTPAYRGTTADEIIAKDRQFVAHTPETASSYAGYIDPTGTPLDDIPKNELYDMYNSITPNGNVMPLLIKNSKKAIKDAPLTGHEMLPEGKNIRSRFAAFDPMKKDSANILASMLLGTTVASQYRDKKK